MKQLSSFGNGKLFSKLLVFAEVDAGPENLQPALCNGGIRFVLNVCNLVVSCFCQDMSYRYGFIFNMCVVSRIVSVLLEICP